MFIRTTAINKILKLKKFCRGIQGGSSAGKTYAILPILIDIATKTPLSEISVVAESIPHLKRGAMKDFKKIMVETGRFFDDRWNATDFKYTFANGSQIEFFSADNDAKLRGARRDWLYMNEANNMNFHSYTELASRTKKGVYLDWNPTDAFWFHDELINDADVDFLIINYMDNEACPESALNFITKAKQKADAGSAFWTNWYRVYGLGEIGSLEGVVFNNWTQCDKIPNDAEFISYGLDWGFTNDPTSLIEVYRYESKIYVNELLYQTQLTNSDIVAKLKAFQVNTSQCIVADSAEPKSIQDLTNAGYYVEPARKGPDSIKASIDRLQQYEIVVTKNSLNLIKELRQYKWAKDREGKALNAPEDVMNHAIDCLRYVGLNKLSQFENSGDYSFADSDEW
jgi:phage terminase large subunit